MLCMFYFPMTKQEINAAKIAKIFVSIGDKHLGAKGKTHDDKIKVTYSVTGFNIYCLHNEIFNLLFFKMQIYNFFSNQQNFLKKIHSTEFQNFQNSQIFPKIM